jgi:anion-transporting  ArsA/GET3 family ATPase
MNLARLHVVLGKGGVGKSTVSAALAVALTRRGMRVLAVELDAAGGLARALSVRPERAGEIVASPSGVAVAWLEGGAALAEYLERVMKLGALLEPVVSHPVYRAFVGAAPGLKELMVIGKVRDELVLHEVAGQTRWDAVVLDAGASGHALELLRMPSTAARTFRAGRVHRQARAIRALLSDPARTAAWVVTTAEEMAVAEAVGLVDTLRGELGISVAEVVINGCREIAPNGFDDTLRALGDGADQQPIRQALVELALRALGWQRVQEQCIVDLEQRTARHGVRLPLMDPALGAPSQVEALSRALAEVAP